MGNANQEIFMRFKFKHHRKMPLEDKFAFTPFCLPYQIGDVCPDGDHCKNNHWSHSHMIHLDEETKLKVGKVDSFFTAVLKWHNQDVFSTPMGHQLYRCDGDELTTPQIPAPPFPRS